MHILCRIFCSPPQFSIPAPSPARRSRVDIPSRTRKKDAAAAGDPPGDESGRFERRLQGAPMATAPGGVAERARQHARAAPYGAALFSALTGTVGPLTCAGTLLTTSANHRLSCGRISVRLQSSNPVRTFALSANRDRPRPGSRSSGFCVSRRRILHTDRRQHAHTPEAR